MMSDPDDWAGGGDCVRQSGRHRMLFVQHMTNYGPGHSEYWHRCHETVQVERWEKSSDNTPGRRLEYKKGGIFMISDIYVELRWSGEELRCTARLEELGVGVKYIKWKIQWKLKILDLGWGAVVPNQTNTGLIQTSLYYSWCMFR